jgi:hypothetical protein
VLDLGSYLLGILQIALLAGFASLGAAALRWRLLPTISGAPGHLATAVLALALLLWPAELLGSFGAFEPLPYLLAVTVVGLGAWTLCRGWRRGWGAAAAPRLRSRGLGPSEGSESPGGAARRARTAPDPADRTRGRAAWLSNPGLDTAVTIGALVVAAVAVVKFGAEVRAQLGTGMTGFDSTWYHGPFAAGFFQSGDTWSLHFIAPQFLAWFYPANSELFHAVGMLAFERDVLSPLLNLGWFLGCLVACWCIGRPYGVAPMSLALGAIALSVPAFTDQAGEARNDIVGAFFLLAAVAIALNAWAARGEGGRSLPRGALIVAGLAAGVAAGTKLNFLLPAAVLVLGLALVAPAGARLRALAATGLAALAAAGYWYLRNLAHSGNPLPWIDSLGPISLPAPEQALGGREAHSVLGYLGDGSVWSDWLLPGLHEALWIVWPLLLLAPLAGLLLSLGRRADPILRVAGLVGLTTMLAWLIAPTSASGPDGMPRGFESGLRYLVPALVLGVTLVPVMPAEWLRGKRAGHLPNGRILKVPPSLGRHLSGREVPSVLAAAAFLALIVIGYPVQRHYLENRYANPSFTTPGLNAAFAWSRSISDARIATTSTRQYPLFGTDLSNRVEFVGVEQPHGGFVAPTGCRRWRRLLSEGDYDYVVASRDRIEAGKPPYPASARWTEGPTAEVILRIPPMVLFELKGPLDPSACGAFSAK